MLELYDEHLVDTCNLERFVEVDKTNKRVFEPVEVTKCRIHYVDVVIKHNTEEETLSRETIYLSTKVSDMDRINGMDILEVFEYKSLLTNEVMGYRVRV